VVAVGPEADVSIGPESAVALGSCGAKIVLAGRDRSALDAAITPMGRIGETVRDRRRDRLLGLRSFDLRYGATLSIDGGYTAW
jgi:hypothetical protein